LSTREAPKGGSVQGKKGKNQPPASVKSRKKNNEEKKAQNEFTYKEVAPQEKAEEPLKRGDQGWERGKRNKKAILEGTVGTRESEGEAIEPEGPQLVRQFSRGN